MDDNEDDHNGGAGDGPSIKKRRGEGPHVECRVLLASKVRNCRPYKWTQSKCWSSYLKRTIHTQLDIKRYFWWFTVVVNIAISFDWVYSFTKSRTYWNGVWPKHWNYVVTISVRIIHRREHAKKNQMENRETFNTSQTPLAWTPKDLSSNATVNTRPHKVG